MTTSSGDVLHSEQTYFDREAAELDERQLLIPDAQIDRYRHARSRPGNIPKEELFARLLPLAGKRVLDYGCGTGENAVLLAACGADVTAFDLSPISVARARQRGSAHGLADRIRFDVAPAGHTPYAPHSFDVICGFAILHHLHLNLPAIYTEIDRLLTPQGRACFIEPLADSATLRMLRRLIPIPREGTADERPLRRGEIELLRRHNFGHIEYVHFHCFSRLYRLIDEGAGRMLRVIDHHAQRIFPPLRHAYGIALVIAGR